MKMKTEISITYINSSQVNLWQNVKQQSVRKHMTSGLFCEGIFVNEMIPKLNKTLPGIFNIRILSRICVLRGQSNSGVSSAL